MVKPRQRRKLAQAAVSDYKVTIRLACETYGISERADRYQAKLSDENATIAYFHLRNVQGFGCITLPV